MNNSKKKIIWRYLDIFTTEILKDFKESDLDCKIYEDYKNQAVVFVGHKLGKTFKEVLNDDEIMNVIQSYFAHL